MEKVLTFLETLNSKELGSVCKITLFKSFFRVNTHLRRSTIFRKRRYIFGSSNGGSISRSGTVYESHPICGVGRVFPPSM